jgi:enterochelin esterase-like enzyme
MRRSKTWIPPAGWLAVWLLATSSATTGQPMAPPAVESPQVHEDRRVTFRIHAPKAVEVTLWGDWMGGPDAERFTKGDDDVWSITIGPLEPDYYSYSLWVDGVKTLDPANVEIKRGVRSIDNMFFVRGAETEFMENKRVPHGQIRQVWFHSDTLGEQRRMHVYSPPGYDQDNRPLPVFFLLHGGGDDDSGWSTIGRAGFILDNLLAEGKIQPMLVVMPNGSLPLPPDLPRRAPGGGVPPELASALEENQRKFVRMLMQEVVPEIERSFRVRSEREHRAIAGLSMGGGQTVEVVSTHPDAFAYAAVWSAGIWSDAEHWESRNLSFLRNEEVNQWIRRFEITIGDADFLLEGSKALSEVLTRHGIRHQYQLTEGGHTWINWRRYLKDFLTVLFQPDAGRDRAAVPDADGWSPSAGDGARTGWIRTRFRKLRQ